MRDGVVGVEHVACSSSSKWPVGGRCKPTRRAVIGRRRPTLNGRTRERAAAAARSIDGVSRPISCLPFLNGLPSLADVSSTAAAGCCHYFPTDEFNCQLHQWSLDAPIALGVAGGIGGRQSA